MEKSLGFSQHYVDGVPTSKKISRFQNTSEEHIEIKTFRGESDDEELHPTRGGGAISLWKRISDLKQHI